MCNLVYVAYLHQNYQMKFDKAEHMHIDEKCQKIISLVIH
jgi:hypothetical protein